jgi:hypothetical protein
LDNDPAHIRDDVKHKLAVLEETLLREPLIVADANRALKEAVSKIIIDPEACRLIIYWHHANEPTEGGPFFSRHNRMFEDVDTERG